VDGAEPTLDLELHCGADGIPTGAYIDEIK
jgi:hypothetical protein